MTRKEDKCERLQNPAICNNHNMKHTSKEQVHLWQSRVEIEGYFITYFDRITVFEAPYR